MPPSDTLADALPVLLAAAVPFLRALALVLPTASLVPALTLRGAPSAVRGAIAVALAAPLAPAMHPAPFDTTLAWVLLGDALRGLPLAIVIATPLWVATQVGAVADVLRGAPEPSQAAPPPAADGARGSLATLTALLVASAWLAGGGVVRALGLLLESAPVTGVAPWALAARTLADGIRLGFAASSGVLVAAVALEVALASMARAAAPISVQPLAMLARPVVALVALALSLDAVRHLVGG